MANKKITELTEVSSFTSDDDLIPIVINTDTVPSNASISKANLQTAIIGGGSLVTLDTAQTITGEKTFNADMYFTGERYIYFEDGQYLEISDINGDNYIVIDNNLVDINGKAFSLFSTTSFNGVYTSGTANDPLVIDARQNNVIFDLGTNGNRVTPSVGDVLACTNVNGTVEWQTPSGGSFDPSTDETITGNWEFSNDLAVSSISNPTANVFKVGGNNMLLLEQNSVGGNQSVSFEVGVGSLKSFTFSAPGGQRLERANFSLEQGMVIKNGNIFTFNAPREILDVGGNVIANGYKIPNGLSTDVLLADGTTTTLPSGGQLLSRQFGTNITFYSGNEWTRPAPGSDFQTINERSFSTGATATVRTTGIDLLNIPANAQLKNMHFTFRKNFLAPNCTQIQIQILARNYDVNGEYNSTSPVVLQTETLTPNNGGTYFSDCNFFDVDLSGIASTTVARNITVCFRQTDDADTSYTARTNCLLTYQI